MKKTIFLLALSVVILSGCDMSHNFMDVDNPNAKEDLMNIIGTGNIPKINKDNIIPDSLSGTREDVKGYANKYYEDSVSEYVDKAKEGLSGATQTLKGFYNEGVDQLGGAINDKVSGAISGELNKLKIK